MGDQDRRGVFQRVIANNSRNPSKELELNHSAILYPAFIYLTYFSLAFPYCNIFFDITSNKWLNNIPHYGGAILYLAIYLIVVR